MGQSGLLLYNPRDMDSETIVPYTMGGATSQWIVAPSNGTFRT